MSNFIVGEDISYAQGVIDWNIYKNNTNFVIIQSSYGNGYFDSQYGNNKSQVLQTTLPHGYYHFAYPDLNNAVDEANWFLHALSAIKPLQDGEVLFLDYERNCNDNVAWVKLFMDTLSTALGGYKPLLYTYQDMLTTNDFTPVVNEGYGLWIAAPTNDPTNNTFQTGAFPFAALQQWGTQEVPGITGQTDADIFFGDSDTFLKYGFKSQAIPTPTQQPVTIVTPRGPVAPVTPITPITPITPASNPPAQPAQESQVKTLTNPEVKPGETTIQVPVTATMDNTQPISTKPLPPATPQKPPMNLRDRIVFFFLSIFSALKAWKAK